MKIVKYLILELLFIILVINSSGLFIDELICMDAGINNYQKFDWNNYFHWFREDLNNVCRFSPQSLFMYFWFVITYYTFFKIITFRRFPFGCKLRFLIPEMIIFILSFGSGMIFDNQFEITQGSMTNAAVGLLYMFFPLILYMIFLYIIFRLITNSKEYTRILNKQESTKSSSGALLFLASIFIFPPILTVLYSIFVFFFICWFVYIKIPRLFIKMTADQKINHKYLSIKLVLSTILGIGSIIGELFFCKTFYLQLPEVDFVDFFACYIAFAAIIRLIYYGLIASIWQENKTTPGCKEFIKNDKIKGLS